MSVHSLSVPSLHTPPTESLWGPIEHCETIAPGIYRVTTLSHGGYLLCDERLAQMPPALRHPEGHAFEEDCRWCLVVLAFPDLFSPETHINAKDTCRNWFPDIWEAWTGITLDPNQSYMKKQQHFYKQHEQDWIVTAAWGDWHPRVPQGFVAGRAYYGGRRTPQGGSLGPTSRFFLIPQDEYAQQRPFVIDLTRHREIPPLE